MRRLKLIWDFRGPDAVKIAEHHDIHLKQYIEKHGVKNSFSGFENMNEIYGIAFIVVDEEDMKPIRDALRPHRGEIFED